MEVLSHAINRMVSNGDDLLLFQEASVTQAQVMEVVLRNFCMFFGKKVNLSKSKVWYSKNTPHGTIHAITAQVGIPFTTNLERYFGFPLLPSRISSQHFQFLEEKIRAKLGQWQSKLLSRAAKLLLIQSVCSTITTYMMNVCKLPERTITTLERIHRNFFWGDTTAKRSIHVVGWEQICQPRDKGGLRLRPL